MHAIFFILTVLENFRSWAFPPSKTVNNLFLFASWEENLPFSTIKGII